MRTRRHVFIGQKRPSQKRVWPESIGDIEAARTAQLKTRRDEDARVRPRKRQDDGARGWKRGGGFGGHEWPWVLSRTLLRGRSPALCRRSHVSDPRVPGSTLAGPQRRGVTGAGPGALTSEPRGASWGRCHALPPGASPPGLAFPPPPRPAPARQSDSPTRSPSHDSRRLSRPVLAPSTSVC